jgi:hypothetical protein
MKAESVPVEIETLSCELCLTEIPVSEANSEEATEYVVYFCGLDCYARWRQQLPDAQD